MQSKPEKASSQKPQTDAGKMIPRSSNRSIRDLDPIQISTQVEPKAKSKQAAGISRINYIPWLCMCLAATGLQRMMPNSVPLSIGILCILTLITSLRFADTKYHWSVGLTAMIPVVQIVTVIFALILPSGRTKASERSQTAASFGLIGWIFLATLIVVVVSVGILVFVLLFMYFQATVFR